MTIYGTCEDESLVTEIFGSVTEFARQIEINGDEFTYCRGVDVTYNSETDIHTFAEASYR